MDYSVAFREQSVPWTFWVVTLGVWPLAILGIDEESRLMTNDTCALQQVPPDASGGRGGQVVVESALNTAGCHYFRRMELHRQFAAGIPVVGSVMQLQSFERQTPLKPLQQVRRVTDDEFCEVTLCCHIWYLLEQRRNGGDKTFQPRNRSSDSNSREANHAKVTL
ncbi:hypothetical protein GQ600_3978 [Phytophthora cactorum]|nr:hypothetical protein GQ600_3978 [Phytophthora cactorum]